MPACEILVLMAYMQKHILASGLIFDLNTHTDFSSEARSLNFHPNPGSAVAQW